MSYGRMKVAMDATIKALGRKPVIAVLPHDDGHGFTVWDSATPWCTHGAGLHLAAATDLAKRRPWMDERHHYAT